jgi:hypothetical protein
MGIGRRRLRFVCLLVALSLVLPMSAGAALAHDDARAKLGPELRALYAAYREARESGRAVVSPDPAMPIVEDRVLIDAVAAGDVGELRRSLVDLGMREAVTAGRIVSGQLPIAAIPAIAALAELRFARAARSTTQRPR